MSDQDSREQALQRDLRTTHEALTNAREEIRELRVEIADLRATAGEHTVKMVLEGDPQAIARAATRAVMRHVGQRPQAL